MAYYLLSTHSVEGVVREPTSEEEQRRSWQQMGQLEQDMASSGAWIFSARLHDPDTATVVRSSGGEVLTTDGPFTESKEHLAGFYIIEAEDLDAALGWAARTSEIIDAPIEVRSFAAFAHEPVAFADQPGA